MGGGKAQRGFIQPLKTAGFTLIELLISIAIIGIITGIVLIKYSAFDSTTLLKGTAFEIALNLRDMQVKSVSVVRNDNNTFDSPYGITFTPLISGVSDGKTYTFFRFGDEDTDILFPKPRPRYDPDISLPASQPSPGIDDIGSVTLDRSMYIKDVCVVDSSDTYCSSDGSIERLDISFRRPEFAALFWAEGYGNSVEADMTNISRAEIVVASTNNVSNPFTIVVSRLGQVSVK